MSTQRATQARCHTSLRQHHVNRTQVTTALTGPPPPCNCSRRPEFAFGALQGALRLHHADCASAGDGAAHAYKPSGVAAAQLVYGWAMLWHVTGKGGATRQACSKRSAGDDCWPAVWPPIGREGVLPPAWPAASVCYGKMMWLQHGCSMAGKQPAAMACTVTLQPSLIATPCSSASQVETVAPGRLAARFYMLMAAVRPAHAVVPCEERLSFPPERVRTFRTAVRLVS